VSCTHSLTPTITDVRVVERTVMKVHRPKPSNDHRSLPVVPDHDAIARLAHSLWEARGRPEGSPNEDWFNAQRELIDGRPDHADESSPHAAASGSNAKRPRSN
jgi:hypothetical protein